MEKGEQACSVTWRESKRRVIGLGAVIEQCWLKPDHLPNQPVSLVIIGPELQHRHAQYHIVHLDPKKLYILIDEYRNDDQTKKSNFSRAQRLNSITFSRCYRLAEAPEACSRGTSPFFIQVNPNKIKCCLGNNWREGNCLNDKRLIADSRVFNAG